MSHVKHNIENILSNYGNHVQNEHPKFSMRFEAHNFLTAKFRVIERPVIKSIFSIFSIDENSPGLRNIFFQLWIAWENICSIPMIFQHHFESIHRISVTVLYPIETLIVIREDEHDYWLLSIVCFKLIIVVTKYIFKYLDAFDAPVWYRQVGRYTERFKTRCLKVKCPRAFIYKTARILWHFYADAYVWREWKVINTKKKQRTKTVMVWA